MVLPVNQYIKPRDELNSMDESKIASSGGQLYVAKKAKRNGMEMKIYAHGEDQEKDQEVFSICVVILTLSFCFFLS